MGVHGTELVQDPEAVRIKVTPVENLAVLKPPGIAQGRRSRSRRHKLPGYPDGQAARGS